MAYVETTGFGCIVKLNDGASNAFTAFDGATMTDVPWGSAEFIKYLTMGQSTHNYNKLVGPTDPGSFTFECLYDNATYQRLVAVKHLKYIATGVATQWQITVVDDTSTNGAMLVTVNGILDKVEMSTDPSKVNTLKVTVEAWGVVSVTP